MGKLSHVDLGPEGYSVELWAPGCNPSSPASVWGPSRSSGFTRFWCAGIVLTCCHVLHCVSPVTEAAGHGSLWQCVTACCCAHCVGTTCCSCYPWREAVCVWCIHRWAVLSSRMTWVMGVILCCWYECAVGWVQRCWDMIAVISLNISVYIAARRALNRTGRVIVVWLRSHVCSTYWRARGIVLVDGWDQVATAFACWTTGCLFLRAWWLDSFFVSMSSNIRSKFGDL